MYFAPPDPAELLAKADADMDLILDQPIYRRMRGNGSWPLLINLERQELGNVIKPNGKPARRLGLELPEYNRVQHFVAYGLSTCRLCRYGIATPGITEATLKLSYDNWHR